MSNINNKNLIFVGMLTLAILFTFIPFDTAEAAKYYGYGENRIRKTSVSAGSSAYVSGSNAQYKGYGGQLYNEFSPTYGVNSTPSSNNQKTTAENLKPIIDSISPNTVDSGEGEMEVMVYGANFVRNSVVKFNSSDRATTYLSPTKLKVKLTDTDINGSGEYLITVFNPLPGGGYSNPEFFAILGGPTEAKTPTDQESNLAAGAIFGSDGFFPNSFMGWLLLSILILLGVVLWRKLYLSDKEKHAPLKHA